MATEILSHPPNIMSYKEDLNALSHDHQVAAHALESRSQDQEQHEVAWPVWSQQDDLEKVSPRV